ncbi:MAG: LptA/OstA family protein [Azospirillaceae bacterium]|nr:LptA/OstA family protein [Azospirillaceae bacterium]
MLSSILALGAAAIPCPAAAAAATPPAAVSTPATTPPAGAAVPATPGAAAGVTAPLPTAGAAGSGQPVEINADQTLEWHQEQKAYVARGNALARQGVNSVAADVLTAYYRDLPSGGTQIYRYAASGNVRILNPARQVYGDDAVYDVDKLVAVVTGDHLKMTTATDVVTARDSIEYWDDRKIAVARGNAVAVRNQDAVRGDILVATLKEAPPCPPGTPVAPAQPAKAAPGAKSSANSSNRMMAPPPKPACKVVAPGAGNAAAKPAGGAAPGSENDDLVMDRIDAEGHVVVTTPTDVAIGRRGVWHADTDKAILTGDVRITRGQDQIDGDIAEVDMNTGISRMLPGAANGGRVKGLFMPGQAAGIGLSPVKKDTP